MKHDEEHRIHNNGSMPLCDSTDGLKCERIKSWKDGDGKIHRNPIKLLPENYLAIEIYDKIASLSSTEEYVINKGKNKMTVWFNNMSAMEMVLSIYKNDLEDIDIHSMMDKLGIIHNIKLKAALQG